MTVAAASAVKSDLEIQKEVLQELRWDTRVKPTEIGVEVDKGVVTLTGTVDSYAKKIAAREAAHRVFGARDVADDVRVKLPGTLKKTDTEIAKAVRLALEWDAFVNDVNVQTTVADGWVTLEGTVDSLREKDDAERAVRRLNFVVGVTDRLKVKKTKADAAELRRSIEKALERQAERDASRVHVQVDDGKIVLGGHVGAWGQRAAVLDAVRHAEGVQTVKDELSVVPWE